MNSPIAIIAKPNDISAELLTTEGRLKLLSYKEYVKYSHDELMYFGHLNARYGFPTIELAEYIKTIINGRIAIEIGAGSGDLGHYLGIHMTDSKIQEDNNIQNFYKVMRQPLIKYPADVEKIEALEAVKKYKPQVVIGSWVTTYASDVMSYGSSPYGIKEDKILELVDTYIVIGNLDNHGDKPIRKLPHTEVNEKFIISRAKNPENNRIFIWKKNGKNC